ncbi:MULTISPECIES: DUF58 domain-containing protein [unclassified Bifidobacterium]|uniref:DUF58 domain-containing protein n=1 Tax=unclassified Bifidobacterium TaxID=2608897 RepID=UPI0023F97B22|nr:MULTISPECIES: DUF58 domain-containing protein [unclassified Bifidobacterium]WEV66433.1 DUF58 domain-containing protein [Bifidobacterium sp. ESL0764]WEV76288.1 DUF58 domain-containing protein [Bifidobacterium sp. ESL0800]
MSHDLRHVSPASRKVRRQIETLSSTLTLPTVRRALGVLEGEHSSSRLGGNNDPMSTRDYTFEDEARLIDWKASAKLGHPMVIDRERLVTSRVHLLVDNGLEMEGRTISGETATEVAGNAMCMFAALSARRHDKISLVFADSLNIIRKPFKGGLAQFEKAIDDAVRGQSRPPRNFEALLSYARTLNDKGSLVVIATDGHALNDNHLHSLRLIAAMHPLMLIDIETLNPFRKVPFGQVTDGADGRRIPAFMIGEQTAKSVDTHRRYLTAQLQERLKASGATLICVTSSEDMFSQFIHLVSVTLKQTSFTSPEALPLVAGEMA